MHLKCKRYPVMDGEPQLGSVNECELIGDYEELYSELADIIVGTGSVPREFCITDDITYEDIQLTTSDYLSHEDVLAIESRADGVNDDTLRKFVLLKLRG